MGTLISDWIGVDGTCQYALVARHVPSDHQVLIDVVEFEAGVDLPGHCHPTEQLTIVVSGSIRWHLYGPNDEADREVVTTAGQAISFRPNVYHKAEILEKCLLIDAKWIPDEMSVRNNDSLPASHFGTHLK